MCCTQVGDKQLLVTTRGKDGITAYNIDSDKLQWSVKGKLPGMETVLNAWGLATDGYGHLFVCDYDSACIHKFSARGVYIGAVLKKGDQGFGQPWGINCYARSSLIVVHITNAQYQISKAQDALDDVDEMEEEEDIDEEVDEEELSPNTSDESAEQIPCEDSPPQGQGVGGDVNEDASLNYTENGIVEQETLKTQEAEMRLETQKEHEHVLPNTAVKPLMTLPEADKIPIPSQQGNEQTGIGFSEVNEAEKNVANEEQAVTMTCHEQDTQMIENSVPQETTIVIEDEDETLPVEPDKTLGMDRRRSLEPKYIIHEMETGRENLPEVDTRTHPTHSPETRKETAEPFEKDLNMIPENVPTVYQSISTGKGAENIRPIVEGHEVTPDDRHIPSASEVKEKQLHGKTSEETPEITSIAFRQTPSGKEGGNMQSLPVHRHVTSNNEKNAQDEETPEDTQNIRKQIPPAIPVQNAELFEDGRKVLEETPGVHKQTLSDKEGKNIKPNGVEIETSSIQHEMPQISGEEVVTMSEDAPVENTESLVEGKTPGSTTTTYRETPSRTEEEHVQPTPVHVHTVLNTEKNTEVNAENKQALDKMEKTLEKAPLVYRHIPSKNEMTNLNESSTERNNNEKLDADEKWRRKVDWESPVMMEKVAEQPDAHTNEDGNILPRRHSSIEGESTVEFKTREDMENWLAASPPHEIKTTVEFTSRDDMERWLKDASDGESAIERQDAEETEKVPEVLPERITPVQFTMEEIRNIPLPPEPPPPRFQESRKWSENSSRSAQNAIIVPKVENQEQQTTELMSNPNEEATFQDEISNGQDEMQPLEESSMQIHSSELSNDVPEEIPERFIHIKINEHDNEDSLLREMAPQPEIQDQPEIEGPPGSELENWQRRMERQTSPEEDNWQRPLKRQTSPQEDNWQRPLERQTSPQEDNWQRPLERDTSPQEDNWQRPLERDTFPQEDNLQRPLERDTSPQGEENWQRPLERETSPQVETWQGPLERETSPEEENWQRPLERETSPQEDNWQRPLERETSPEEENWQRPLERDTSPQEENWKRPLERETSPQEENWQRPLERETSPQEENWQRPFERETSPQEENWQRPFERETSPQEENWQRPLERETSPQKENWQRPFERETTPQFAVANESTVWVRDPKPGPSTQQQPPESEDLFSIQGRILEKGDCISKVFHEADQQPETDVDMRLSAEHHEGVRELTSEEFSRSDNKTRPEVLRRRDQSASDEDLQSDESSESFTEGPPIQGLTFMSYMSLLPDGSVVVCGKHKGWPFKREEWKMVRYNSHLDRTFSASGLKRCPDGMSDVKLGGKHCIAVAYS